MARALLAIALVLTLAADGLNVAVADTETVLPETSTGDDAELDDENDSSPFTIVVEHVPGWRCGGSLVTLRTALTTAWCARGRGLVAARELRAIAASTRSAPPGSRARRDGVRRVARLAFAVGADAEAGEVGEVGEESPRSWTGAVADLALLELESPFGTAARARPILMATAAAQCAAPATCHVARALPAGVLRIVDAALQPAQRCVAAAKHWIELQERALCLTGPELCPSDWGAGVVCGGKLCGVVSRSTRGVTPPEPLAEPEPAAAGCGHTHAAQSVPRWQRFLQCAHKAHACKRGGECVEVCNERGLLEDAEDEEEVPLESSETTSESASSPPAARGRPREPPPLNDMWRASSEARRPHPSHSTQATTHTTDPESGRRSHPRVRSRGPASTPATRTVQTVRTARTSRPARTGRPTRSTAGTLPSAKLIPPAPHDDVGGDHKIVPRFEFEPNRADFKAGEYGDNAADYSSDEAGGTDVTNSTDTTDSTDSTVPRSIYTFPALTDSDLSIELSQKSEQLSPAAERRAAAPSQLQRPDPPKSATSASSATSATFRCESHLIYYTVLILLHIIYT